MDRPTFALLCYDGKPMTSDTSSLVDIHWVYSECWGVARDILVKPNDIVVAGEWLAVIDEGALETIEEEAGSYVAEYSKQN